MEKSYSYQVEGMTCGNCALTISRLLERKGMSHISANAATGELHFTNTTETDVTDVLDAIDKLGYTVVREHAHSQEQAHDHEHGHGDNHLFLWCIILTIPLLLHMFVSWPLIHHPWFQLALSTPVLLMGFYAFGLSAWRSLLHRLPNMNVLILLGAAAAYVYSLIGFIRYGAQAHQYLFFETTASIITLVMTGNWLEQRTVKTTTASIEALARLQPAFARLLMTDSLGRETVTEVESRYVKAGDIVVVGEGDAIPVDGTVVKGNGFADEHMITGESEPVGKGTGDAVVGGTLLVQGPLRIQATTVGSASVLSGIIRIVREAQAVKPPLQKLADRISAIFVPLVALIAVLTFVVNYVWVVPFEAAMMRSIAVMVISCPCAMGLATPAAVAVGLGRAARNGILIKGGDTLERMKTLKQVVFDKTGTLTQGTLSISRYESAYLPEADFKSIVAVLESASSHPIARSVARQWSNTTGWIADGIRELKGKGMEAKDTAGHTWQLGSSSWLWREGMPEGYDLYLLEEGRFAGALQLEDELRPDAAETIARLREMGYKTIMLSGDREEKCREIAEQLGLDEYHARQSPEQKYEMLGRLLAQAPVAMVGDGINDAPALAKATVGISLSNATQIAIQSASVILSNNHLSSLPKAIRLGIYTDATIRQNLFWAMLYNVIAIPVAAVGLLTPTWGAGIMALSDVVLILNSLRLGVRRL